MPCIGTLNPPLTPPEEGNCEDAEERLLPSWEASGLGRFMKRRLSFFACIGTMNPLIAWSPGFSRSKPFGPPQGGTPNQPRFMESLHGFVTVHWDHATSDSLESRLQPVQAVRAA